MDIGQLTEFVGNHPLLVFAFFAILALLIGSELKTLLSGVKEIGPIEATRMLNHKDAVMIDMRDDKNYNSGHIINAVHAPDVNAEKLGKYRDRPIIVYCNRGNSSSGYSGRLRKLGFESVYCLKGGLSAWERAQLPLTKGK